MTSDAQEMLLALQAAGLPVTGLHIADLNDEATWHVYGTVEGPSNPDGHAIEFGPEQSARARATLRSLVAPSANTAQFWPKDQTPLERDVARIKDLLRLS